MTDAPAMEQKTRRVDRLLRSLVGVVDLRPSWDRSGRLAQVHVLKAPDIQDHQLVRNVVSALKAGFGLRLETSSLRIYADADLFGASTEHLPNAVPAPQPAPAPVAAAAVPAGGANLPASPGASGSGGGAGAGSSASSANVQALVGGQAAGPVPGDAAPGGAPARPGNGAANPSAAPANGGGSGAGSGAAAAGEHPYGVSNGGDATSRVVRNGGMLYTAHGAAPGAERHVPGHADAKGVVAGGVAIERMDVERQGGTLRCHVVLAMGGRRYSAIAEVPDAPTVEAELAARVTLDALRAGALTDARLEGIGFTTINDVTYLVAAIRESGGGGRRASAAPMVGSMARTAATATLAAVGPITPARQNAAERMLGGN
jgi:hypothetical protein